MMSSEHEPVWWLVKQKAWGHPYASSVHLTSKTGKSTACGTTLGDKEDLRYGPMVVTCASCHKLEQKKHVAEVAGTFSPRLRRRRAVIRQDEITEALARFEKGGGMVHHDPTYAEPRRNTVGGHLGAYMNPFAVE